MKSVVEKETVTSVEGVDELAGVNDIKLLAIVYDDREAEVNSTTSKSKYKIKCPFDHYYCSCPA